MSRMGMSSIVIPSSIAANVVQPLNEKQYCDFCCKPLSTAFEMSCSHTYCGECVLAIAQQENVDIPADLLREAAEQAYQDKPAVIQASQLQNTSASATALLGQPATGMSCPLCLKLILKLIAVNPQKRSASRLCQECGQRERCIRCSSCAVELCEECDSQIHQFSATRAHQRTPVANAGNAAGMTVQLPCQAQAHKAVIAAAMVKGADVNQYGMTHPLYVEATSQNVAAEFYCMEERVLICKFCAHSDFYKSKKIVPSQEAVELRVRELREETDKCRQLAGELRQLMYKYQECDRLDENLHQIALAELRTCRDVVLSALQSRFDGLETELADILLKRKEQSTKQQESLCEVVGKMMNAVSSAEKHMLARQPIVFLGEFNQLAQDIKHNLRLVLADLESRPEPRRAQFPKPEHVEEVKRAIGVLCLNETQQMVEAAGVHVRQCISCRDCGNTLVTGATTLRQVARKQKGCLFGLLLESLEPECISLDTVKGQPGSRHVICRRCGRELGRWAQPDAPDKKFTPGYVFISQNVVK